MRFWATAKRASEIVRDDGPAALAAKMLTKAYHRFGDLSENLYLLPDDVTDSHDVTGWQPGSPHDGPLTIGWILTGPAEGSGGHTTIFRMIEALEQRGHRCVVYIYDGVGSAADRYDEVIRRWWPRVNADVRDLSAGLHGCDAYVATAWPTAHVLAKHGDVPGARFYLAQDYEPYFYPRGAAYELAAESYRFGFETLTIGAMVANELREHHGVTATIAPFGCDTAAYFPLSDDRRSGIAFYAKPGVARRGYELGILALAEFHRRRPEIPIRMFGIRARSVPFPAEVHAHLTPDELNRLYNTCSAGIALSFTNVSLIATELAAAGVVPVVNDHPGPRADLDASCVQWARPTPSSVAQALVRAHDLHVEVGPRQIARTVDDISWGPAGDAVAGAIEAGCRGVSRR